MSPFHMSYQGLPAIDIHWQHSYDDSNPNVSHSSLYTECRAVPNMSTQTPPLSHSDDHSTLPQGLQIGHTALGP